jgi:hypothetical protein
MLGPEFKPQYLHKKKLKQKKCLLGRKGQQYNEPMLTLMENGKREG